MRKLLLLLALLVAAPLEAEVPRGELPEGVRPLDYVVDLTVDPRRPTFSGRTEILIETDRPMDMMWIHGLGLRMARAEAVPEGGRPIAARYEEVDPTGVARLSFRRTLPAGRHRLRFVHSAPFMDAAAGLYRAQVDGRWYAWTQFQATDGRRVFPMFDEPRHKTSFTVSITAPEGMRAFANAPAAGEPVAVRGGLRHQFQGLGPMPTYLVALAVGAFDVVEGVVPPNAVRDAPLALRGIATRGQGRRLAFAMAETPKLVEDLELWFGTPHPWPKLDIISSPTQGGAMENNGLMVFDDTLLLIDADAPPAQLRSFGIVMAHEIAHQWFGNLVTPRWWDDIWLNESFADWMGNAFAERWRPDLGVYVAQVAGALGAMRDDSLPQGRPIRQAITDTADINSAFDLITYRKGGQVVEMMRGFLSEERFRAGVRLHLARHWNGNATADDFFRNMAEGSGEPRVEAAWRSFVEQRGVPLITVEPGPTATRLSQSVWAPVGSQGPGPATWTVPVCLGSGEGRACHLLATAEAAVPPVIGTAPWVHPNAGATGYYRFDLPADAWDALVAAAPELPPAEALVVADSLWAGFVAGRGDAAALLEAAPVLARHGEARVAGLLLTELADFVGRAGSGDDRTAVQMFVARVAGAELDAMGINLARGAHVGEAADVRQRRETLFAIAVAEGRAAALSERAAAAARSLMEGDAAALDPAFRVAALRALLRSDDGAAGRLFERAVASDDPLFRRHAVAALGAEGGRAMLDRAFDLRLQAVEVTQMLAAAFRSASARREALSWLEANIERLRPRLGGVLGQFTGITAQMCSEGDAARVEAMFGRQAAALNLGTLDIARPAAAIRQCAAERQALMPGLGAALAAR